MRCPDIPADEPERLLALAQYGLRAERPLRSLDKVMEMAVRLFDVPAAAVNMIGSAETFFAASHGIGACDRRRDVSFCAHAINETELMVVPDARLDARFSDNPLVAGGLIIFYAGVPLRSPSGQALGALCIVDSKPRPDLDTAERETLAGLAELAVEELELRRLEVAGGAGLQTFAERANQSSDAVVGFDAEGRITSWNGAAGRLFGHDRAAMLGQPISDLVTEADRPAMTSVMARVIESAELSGVSTGLHARQADGALFEAEFLWIHPEKGDGTGYAAVVRDVAMSHEGRDALYDLAQFDGLTGLANGRQLREQADASWQAGGAPAIILIDPCKLGALNEWHGQQLGDMILCIVARRLRAVMPEGALVARARGDVFAILLRDGAGRARTRELAALVMTEVSRPMVLGHQALRVDCRCGFAVADQAAGVAPNLIAQAERALAEAKRSMARDPVSSGSD